MSYTKDGAMEFIRENDVKFIRLVFCDIFGALKNVAVMADYLPQVFERGAGFDVSSIDGLMNISESDLHLFPDPSTLAVLPWRPSAGRVARMFCDIKHPDGAAFVGDGRNLLRAAKKQAAEQGLHVKARMECEFYLFEMDDEGNPTTHPHDNAGYLDIAPLDKCENVRRDICLALEELGMAPMGSHHEKGPAQNEIWCRATDILGCADDFITYKMVVRTIAAQHGLFACFMPRPLAGKSGSGLHVNLSLHAAPGAEQERVPQKTFESFVAGILEHIGEATLFMNTTTNSYRRLGSFEAPQYISWAKGNRSQLVRVPFGAADDTRMELRSPDPLCNPYTALTLLLHAGLEGIKNNVALREAANFDFATASDGIKNKYATLPRSLGEAIKAAQDSRFVAHNLPAEVLQKTVEAKQFEWTRYEHAEDKEAFEHECYFERI